MSSNVYKPKDFARMIGKSVLTLQRWDREKILIAHRTKVTNRRYYTHDQYLEYLGIRASSDKKIITYCRVSSSGQKNDLKSQRQAIEIYCTKKAYEVSEWLEEVGSGLNYKRKKFNWLMEQVELGEISLIIVAHKDRLVRFGFEWFEAFATRHGTKIEIMNLESLSPEAEMTKDLLSIIHCFSSRLYGLRKYRKNIKQLIEAEEGQILNG